VRTADERLLGVLDHPFFAVSKEDGSFDQFAGGHLQ
jgi:hypothetical protein